VLNYYFDALTAPDFFFAFFRFFVSFFFEKNIIKNKNFFSSSLLFW